jgi:hypothetical protein
VKKERWLPVAVLAGVLFAVNVVARLVTRFGFHNDTVMSDRVSLGMFSAVGLILAVLAFVWGRRYPVDQWGTRMAGAVLIAMVLTIFVGPFISGTQPFAGGPGAFFAQFGLYAAFNSGGALLGYLVLTALGLDHRSQSLKRFAESKRAKPARVVRR